MQAVIEAFFDDATCSVSYVVADRPDGVCVIIDPLLDFDPVSGRTATRSADKIIAFIQTSGFRVSWILETHVHADHLSAAAYLKHKTGAKTGIGRYVTETQAAFKKIFNLGDEFTADGRHFDRLLDDGDSLPLGSMTIQVMHTPGHTPACVCYLAGDAAFVGDTLFMPDFGCARTDFPGGDAATLYHSIQKIFQLPAETRLFMCHDYQAPGRDVFAWETTVAEQGANNVHIQAGMDEEDFVSFRTQRDARLGVPKLILPAVQVNIRAGEMPPAEDNGVAYLKLPLNTF